MKNKLIIKQDVDGVIRKFVDAVYEFLNNNYPNITPKENPEIEQWELHHFYPDFEIEKFYNILFEEFQERIFYEIAEPYEGATQFMARLNEFKNTHVLIRTHQDNNRAISTIKWLQKYNIEHNGLYYSDSSDDRKNILTKNTVSIDDKLDNLVDNDIGILMTRDWNKDFDLNDYPTINRADTYMECLNIITKIIDQKGLR